VVPYDPSAQYDQRVEPTLDHTTVASLTLPPSFKDIPKLFSKDTGSKVVIDIFLLLGHIMGFP